MSAFTHLRSLHSFALLGALSGALLAACGTDGSGTPDDPPACARGTLEPDLVFMLPLTGPAVDPSTGAIAPPPAGGYVVSTTYLATRPEPAAQQRFGQLMGPIAQALASQPGLLAIEMGTSESCGTGRTFSVWSSTEAMYDFVMGPAHTAAVDAVFEVSRGGSVVTHWTATSQGQVTWDEAAARLTAFDGVTY